MNVTETTASKWKLKITADLAMHLVEVKFWALAEFIKRSVGLPGLKSAYGLDIAPDNLASISDGGGPATVRAILDGTVTAAIIFSTSSAIPHNKFVVLDISLWCSTIPSTTY